jgi:uncharacterized protein (DUF427 family)
MAHVTLEPVPRIRIRAHGVEIVDSTRGFVVHEGSYPPRYYVPRDEVRGELATGQGAGVCPWKGTWNHVDLQVGDRRVANAAWTYTAPTPLCEPIRDFVAFYPEKVDAIEIA